MEVVKLTLIMLMLTLSGSLISQDLTTRQHLTGGTATISPGFQKNNQDINIYLHGLVYFYPEPNVSVNGEVYWFLGGQEQQTMMAENSSLVFGVNYHFAKDGKFDPFVGVMPGLSLVSANDYTLIRPVASEMSVVPLVTINAGLNFHLAKWCNAFVNLRYLKGTLVEHHNEAISLDELRVSFGLGFNFYGKDFYKQK